MADKVQSRLEALLPALVDLQSKHIFSKVEIREIVRTRRNFEYKCASGNVNKKSFLDYLQYEIALETLKEHRCASLGHKRRTSINTSAMSHILGLFGRMVRIWPQDIVIWNQYIDFCLRSGATNKAVSVLMKALSYHPTELNFWLAAADRDLQLGHIEAPRRLLQMAIRQIPDSLTLWEEYFRFEIRCIIQLAINRSTAPDKEPISLMNETSNVELKEYVLGLKHLNVIVEGALEKLQTDQKREVFLLTCLDMISIFLSTPKDALNCLEGIDDLENFLSLSLVELSARRPLLRFFLWKLHVLTCAAKQNKPSDSMMEFVEKLFTIASSTSCEDAEYMWWTLVLLISNLVFYPSPSHLSKILAISQEKPLFTFQASASQNDSTTIDDNINNNDDHQSYSQSSSSPSHQDAKDTTRKNEETLSLTNSINLSNRREPVFNPIFSSTETFVKSNLHALTRCLVILPSSPFFTCLSLTDKNFVTTFENEVDPFILRRLEKEASLIRQHLCLDHAAASLYECQFKIFHQLLDELRRSANSKILSSVIPLLCHAVSELEDMALRNLDESTSKTNLNVTSRSLWEKLYQLTTTCIDSKFFKTANSQLYLHHLIYKSLICHHLYHDDTLLKDENNHCCCSSIQQEIDDVLKAAQKSSNNCNPLSFEFLKHVVLFTQHSIKTDLKLQQKSRSRAVDNDCHEGDVISYKRQKVMSAPLSRNQQNLKLEQPKMFLNHEKMDYNCKFQDDSNDDNKEYYNTYTKIINRLNLIYGACKDHDELCRIVYFIIIYLLQDNNNNYKNSTENNPSNMNFLLFEQRRTFYDKFFAPHLLPVERETVRRMISVGYIEYCIKTKFLLHSHDSMNNNTSDFIKKIDDANTILQNFYSLLKQSIEFEESAAAYNETGKECLILSFLKVESLIVRYVALASTFDQYFLSLASEKWILATANEYSASKILKDFSRYLKNNSGIARQCSIILAEFIQDPIVSFDEKLNKQISYLSNAIII